MSLHTSIVKRKDVHLNESLYTSSLFFLELVKYELELVTKIMTMKIDSHECRSILCNTSMILLRNYISFSLSPSPLGWKSKENQHCSYLCRYPLPQVSEAPKWNLTHWWRKRLNSVAAPSLYERGKREKIESAFWHHGYSTLPFPWPLRKGRK